MITDFFQQSQQSLINLRSQYFRVNDYLSKGQHHMKLSFFDQGKQHYDFDLNSQEYFHEQLDDIVFQKPEVQEDFYSHISRYLQGELNINAEADPESSYLHTKCEVALENNIKAGKEKLVLHFQARLNSLEHKKYLSILRFHNHIEPTPGNLKLLESRTRVIDAEIQSILNRLTRLKASDQFQLSNNKPVPVNENDNATYKILDDEESLHTNIARDDIEVYLRAQGHSRNALSLYWKHYYSLKHISLRQGLDVIDKTEWRRYQHTQDQSKRVREWCQKLISILENNMEHSKVTQSLSLDSVTMLLQSIYNINTPHPFVTPLAPSLSQELIVCMNNSMRPYFALSVSDPNDLYQLVPKLVNFVSILFRYQNKDVVIDEEEDIRLGLEDDIDLQKELLTLLELSWVNKHVKLHYDRYNVKVHLTTFVPDESMKTGGSIQGSANTNTRKNTDIPSDANPQGDDLVDIMCREIMKATNINNYNVWRGYLKTHSESVIRRSTTKFRDFERCKAYQLNSSSDITLAYLNQLYHAKGQSEPPEDRMKKMDRDIYDSLMTKLSITNPVFVESYISIHSLHLRDLKSTLRNLINASRCYYKRLRMDLRTIDKAATSHQCQDRFLIDTNKEERDNMDKLMKMSPSSFILLSLKNNGRGMGSEEEIEYELSQHSIYSYDKIVPMYFDDEEIPQLYVSSAYKSNKYILYDISLKDLNEREERMLGTVSRFISKLEGYVEVNGLEPLVDRYTMLHEVYELEVEYEYEKFKVLEMLMEIYQNEINPLNSSKLAGEMVELMERRVRVDYEESYFQVSYKKEIQILRAKANILSKVKHSILKEEIAEVNQFHQRLTKSLPVPYHQYGIFYEDLPPHTTKKIRKQSQFSQLSQLSFTKNNSSFSSPMRKRGQSNDILEEQESGSQFPNDTPFNLKNYDEYLLTKDLEQVFDEIVGTRVPVGMTDGREEVNEVNRNIHRRAEGGPHFLMRLGKESQVRLPTGREVEFLNFFENLSWSINILHLLEEETQKIIQNYCKNRSTLYQLEVQLILLQISQQLLSKPPIFKTPLMNSDIKWDQAYHLVSKSSKKYREMMVNVFEPPSALSTAFSLPKIIDSLPDFSELQYLDIHSLNSILTLDKPNNIILYRELSLAINLMEVFGLSKKINHAIYQRQALSTIYKELGKALGIEVATNIMEYVKEVGLVIEELKPFQKFESCLLFPEAVQKLGLICEAELTNIHNFLSFVRYHERRVRQVLLLEREMKIFAKHKCFFFNGVVDPKRISIQLTNLKSLVSRVKPMIGAISSQFKQFNYLSSKKPMIAQLETQILNAQMELEDKTKEQKIAKPQKYIMEKKLCLLKQKIIRLFYRDMQKLAKQRVEFLQLIQYNELLSKKTQVFPLGQLFTPHRHSKHLEEKFYFDQRTGEKHARPDGSLIGEGNVLFDPFFLHSLEQLYSQYSEIKEPEGLKGFDVKKEMEVIEGELGISKQIAFDRMVPTLQLDQNQLKSLDYVYQLNESISGEPTIYQSLKSSDTQRGIGNKALEYYHTLNQYINANILQISLSCESVTLLKQLSKNSKDFDTLYPLINQSELDENFTTNIISAMYVYEVKQYQVNKKAGAKTSETAVIDQLTHFFIKRVQGLGLIRELFLPFVDELKKIGKEFYQKSYKEAIHFLKIKTRNIYKLLQLGIMESIKCSKDELLISQLNSLCGLMFSPYDTSHPSSHRPSSITCNLFESNRFNISRKPVKRKDILYKLSSVLAHIPIHFQRSITQFMKQTSLQPNPPLQLSSIKAESFLAKTLSLLLKLGQNNRLRVLSNVRHMHQTVNELILLKKPTEWADKEKAKTALFDMLIQTNNFIYSTVFIQELDSSRSPQTSQQLYQKKTDQLQNRTLAIVNNYQQYISSNKLPLTLQDKLVLKTQYPLSSKEWSSRQLDVYRMLLKKLILNKLIKQHFKVTLINNSATTLRKERIPTNEATKVVNINLVPRVKLNSCFSSPLRQQRTTYISNSHKIAFVQSFINRLRNKVSRVDLLSSGYGFVITVADLENCVNFLNKSLFSFTQKQFKYRMDTFGLYWEMMIEALNLKNKEITELKSKVKYLKARADNINETAFIKKASNLLSENTKLNAKIRDVEKLSQGLEDRLRKLVEIDYHQEIQQLKKENDLLKGKFKQFQELLVSLARDETKKSLASLISDFKGRTSDLLNKNIDMEVASVSASSMGNFGNTRSHLSSPAPPSERSGLLKAPSGQQDDTDTYYQSKLINKMRIFNAFKLSTTKQKAFKEQERLRKEISQLRNVHDTNIVKNEKELLIRKELDSMQIVLLNKMRELEASRIKCEALENENDKLKTWKTNKEKVIENLKNSVISNSVLAPQPKEYMGEQITGRSQTKSQRIPSPRKSLSFHKHLPPQKQPPASKISVKMFGTQPLILQTSYQLSNKQVSWKEKCQELYMENKRMEKTLGKMKVELMRLKGNAMMNQVEEEAGDVSEFLMEEVHSRSNNVSYEKTPSSKRQRFPNINYKYRMMGSDT